MSASIVDRFYVKGEGHLPLSNFWIGDPIPAPHYGQRDKTKVNTYLWPTAEHYFQAAKFIEPEDFEHVLKAHGPSESKRRGRERRPSFRTDWDVVKLEVMRHILSLKFASGRPEADYLLGTRAALLVEGNDWRDVFWGANRDSMGNYTIGQNWLGWLLMSQRAYLCSDTARRVRSDGPANVTNATYTGEGTI